MKKKLCALLLSASMLSSLAVPAFAVDASETNAPPGRQMVRMLSTWELRTLPILTAITKTPSGTVSMSTARKKSTPSPRTNTTPFRTN